MDELLGKTIKVTHIEAGSMPSDKKWEGHTGKVVKVLPGHREGTRMLQVEGMSVFLLSDVDRWEVID